MLIDPLGQYHYYGRVSVAKTCKDIWMAHWAVHCRHLYFWKRSYRFHTWKRGINMIATDLYSTGSHCMPFSMSSFFWYVQRNGGKFHLNNPSADGFVINCDSDEELNNVDIFTTSGMDKAIFFVKKAEFDRAHTVLEGSCEH